MTTAHASAHDAALRSTVLAYLDAHHVVTLATSEPWAAAVFYVNDGFTLYFLSSPRSRHAQRLDADPRVAATVQEDYRDWRSVKGVQLEGTVHVVERTRVADVRKLYAAKFPVIAGGDGRTAAIAAALARIRWYELRPTAIHFLDNAQGFGHRATIDPDALAGGGIGSRQKP
jgi:uncharacterized protein YhbP (UPF0306 family)